MQVRPSLGESIVLLEDRKALQKDVDRLDQWSDNNCLRFNKAKCQVLPLCRSNNNPRSVTDLVNSWT